MQWWVQPTCWTERRNKEEGQAHPSSFCEDEKGITVNVKAYTACTFAYSTRQDKVYSVQRWRCWSDKKDWATMRILPQLCTAMKFITPAQYSKSNQVFCGSTWTLSPAPAVHDDTVWYKCKMQAHYVINTSAANDFVEKYPGEFICLKHHHQVFFFQHLFRLLLWPSIEI